YRAGVRGRRRAVQVGIGRASRRARDLRAADQLPDRAARQGTAALHSGPHAHRCHDGASRSLARRGVDGASPWPSGLMPARAGHEVYLEFQMQGAFVKVTAIDAQSGVEATIVGPVTAPRSTLEAAAVRKLDYLRQKQDGGTG